MLAAPLDHSRGGTVLRGAQTWDLDQYSLFDKIINIKFTRRSGKFFCLRSDYEVQISHDGTPYFTQMRQKPDIRVSYKQVSQGTAVDMGIRITNLFVSNTTVGNEILANTGDPIIQVELQMGYRRQFPDWTMPPLNVDTDESADVTAQDNRLRLFYSMENFTVQHTQEELNTGLRISAQVLAVYPESYPPDRVIYVQCIVGTLDYGLRLKTKAAFVNMASYFAVTENFPQRDTRETAPLTMLEKIFFLYITSRFFRSRGVVYQTYDSRYDMEFTGDAWKGYTRVLNYDAKAHRFITDPAFLMLPVEQRWSAPLDMPNNVFAVADAVNLGVVCVLSDRLLDLSRRNVLPRTFPNGVTADTAAIERVPSIAFQTHLGAQMYEIQAAFPTIRWYQRTDGSFLVYDERETIEELLVGGNIQRVLRQNRDILLPAIYDISIGGLRTIRCPFMGFISTGQRIGFSARYNIGSLVGFMAPPSADAWYTAILIDVEFDTCGDNNTMAIQCTDAAAPAPTAQLGNEEQTDEQAQTAQTIRRVLRWMPLTVVSWEERHKDIVTTTALSSWATLAQVYVLRSDSIKGIEGVPEQKNRTIADGVQYLLSDSRNKDNNSAWFKARGPAPDSETFQGLHEMQLAMLLPGDVVYVPYGKDEVTDA